MCVLRSWSSWERMPSVRSRPISRTRRRRCELFAMPRGVCAGRGREIVLPHLRGGKVPDRQGAGKLRELWRRHFLGLSWKDDSVRGVRCRVYDQLPGGAGRMFGLPSRPSGGTMRHLCGRTVSCPQRRFYKLPALPRRIRAGSRWSVLLRHLSGGQVPRFQRTESMPRMRRWLLSWSQ